jgi:hypothetical protein
METIRMKIKPVDSFTQETDGWRAPALGVRQEDDLVSDADCAAGQASVEALQRDKSQTLEGPLADITARIKLLAASFLRSTGK